MIGVSALSAVLAAIPLSAQAPNVNQLKAAIVSKLPQFIEWPDASLAGRETLDLCVAAPNPFGHDLEELVAGDSVARRPVAVHILDAGDDPTRCHLLFLPADTAPARRMLLQTVASHPIVTVSDDPRFLDAGGMVGLRSVNGRMRFDVNVAAARKVGLRISAQLLQLAASVRGQS